MNLYFYLKCGRSLLEFIYLILLHLSKLIYLIFITDLVNLVIFIALNAKHATTDSTNVNAKDERSRLSLWVKKKRDLDYITRNVRARVVPSVIKCAKRLRVQHVTCGCPRACESLARSFSRPHRRLSRYVRARVKRRMYNGHRLP